MNNSKEYMEEYRMKNKDRIKEKKRIWYIANKERTRKKAYEATARWRKRNKDYIIKDNKEYYRIHQGEHTKRQPWVISYYSSKSRCESTKNKAYRYYGEKGIKCLITKEQIKELWFRDKAYNMKCATLDRIDSKGNYEYSNCQYLEKSDNTKKMWKERRTKELTNG